MSHTATDPVVAIHLPVSRLNLVLEALSQLPWVKVNALIMEINVQAKNELERRDAFLAAQADPEPQQNVKSPAEPGKADSAAS